MSGTAGLRAARLAALEDVRHAFSTRVEDRARFLAFVAEPEVEGVCDRLVTLRQVHGADVLDVRDVASGIEAGAAGYDAAVTDVPGVLLGILTADCVPVLVAAPEQRVVAAIHAGWRGTAARILPRVVEHLGRVHGVPPSALEVALGPAIARCCFEVGEEVVEALDASCSGPATWAAPGPRGKPHVDLAEVNRRQLADAGVRTDRVEHLSPCTRCDAERFASYRREGAAAGRQLSVIGLAPR